ncbi:hypothetical protein RCL1_004115 [Eukaryota sp. TZLM3-RCL]
MRWIELIKSSDYQRLSLLLSASPFLMSLERLIDAAFEVITGDDNCFKVPSSSFDSDYYTSLTNDSPFPYPLKDFLSKCFSTPLPLITDTTMFDKQHVQPILSILKSLTNTPYLSPVVKEVLTAFSQDIVPHNCSLLLHQQIISTLPFLLSSCDPSIVKEVLALILTHYTSSPCFSTLLYSFFQVSLTNQEAKLLLSYLKLLDPSTPNYFIYEKNLISSLCDAFLISFKKSFPDLISSFFLDDTWHHERKVSGSEIIIPCSVSIIFSTIIDFLNHIFDLSSSLSSHSLSIIRTLLYTLCHDYLLPFSTSWGVSLCRTLGSRGTLSCCYLIFINLIKSFDHYILNLNTDSLLIVLITHLILSTTSADVVIRVVDLPFHGRLFDYSCVSQFCQNFTKNFSFSKKEFKYGIELFNSFFQSIITSDFDLLLSNLIGSFRFYPLRLCCFVDNVLSRPEISALNSNQMTLIEKNDWMSVKQRVTKLTDSCCCNKNVV